MSRPSSASGSLGELSELDHVRPGTRFAGYRQEIMHRALARSAPRGMIVQYTTIAFIDVGGQAGGALGADQNLFRFDEAAVSEQNPKRIGPSRAGSIGKKKRR
jgi:hypothetical protein